VVSDENAITMFGRSPTEESNSPGDIDTNVG
jgi:hypothetical protein